MPSRKLTLSLLSLSGLILVSWVVHGSGLRPVETAADEPDGLRLLPGFHATVVAEGLGAIRHLAIRGNGDVYISTLKDQQGNGGGIIALHLDSAHKADQVQRFGSVDGGTGIRFYNGSLYAASSSGVYRFTFTGDALIRAKEPDLIING